MWPFQSLSLKDSIFLSGQLSSDTSSCTACTLLILRMKCCGALCPLEFAPNLQPSWNVMVSKKCNRGARFMSVDIRFLSITVIRASFQCRSKFCFSCQAPIYFHLNMESNDVIASVMAKSTYIPTQIVLETSSKTWIKL